MSVQAGLVYIKKYNVIINKVRARKLFEASMLGDMNLMREIKKIRNGGGVKKAELPDNVANADGEEQIVDKFRVVYAALYSSAGSEVDMLDLKGEGEGYDR